MTALFWLILAVIGLFQFALIAYVVIGWLIVFNIINNYQPVVRSIMQFLSAIIDPLARPIRRHVPSPGGVDLSILILFLLVKALEILIRSSIIPYFY